MVITPWTSSALGSTTEFKICSNSADHGSLSPASIHSREGVLLYNFATKIILRGSAITWRNLADSCAVHFGALVRNRAIDCSGKVALWADASLRTSYREEIPFLCKRLANTRLGLCDDSTCLRHISYTTACEQVNWVMQMGGRSAWYPVTDEFGFRVIYID